MPDDPGPGVGADAVAGEFVELALAHGVLGFGEFTLKSGRRSPYFFNSARFDTGATLAGVARAYAGAVAASGIGTDLLFGPAYKGIPLVAATAVQLAERHGIDLPWAFNRKEAKAHGEGGTIVGHEVSGRVLLLDDIITAGTAIREAVELVAAAGGRVVGIVVAIDRQERGRGRLSAVQEVERDLDCPVLPIVTLAQILSHLERTGRHVEHLPALRAYRAEFGVDQG